MCPSRAEETNPFFQPADDVGIVTSPAHYFFGPLEMDDVIRRIRLPKLLCGTSHVDTRHPDGIAQDGDEQIVCVPIFSEYNKCFYRRTVCFFAVIHFYTFVVQLSCATKVIKLMRNFIFFLSSFCRQVSSLSCYSFCSYQISHFSLVGLFWLSGVFPVLRRWAPVRKEWHSCRNYLSRPCL